MTQLYFPVDCQLKWCCLLLIFSIPYCATQCDDSAKRDTTFDDVDSMYDRFTKRFTGSVSFTGDYASGLSSCRMDPLPPINAFKDWIPVAVGPEDYVHSLMCGTCLKISPRKLKKRSVRDTANENIFSSILEKRAIKTIVEDFEFDPTTTYYGTVVDQCIHCKPGELEMYREGSGRHDVIYEAIDCPDVEGDQGFVRLRTRSCDEENVKKIQIKNTKLPTISLELFQDNHWHCLKRTNDNHFILPSNQLPIRARMTSVTGQVIGFNIDSVDSKKDFMVPSQYYSFENADTVKPSKLKCSIDGPPIQKKINEDEYGLKGRNMTIDDLHKLPNNKHLLTPNGHLIHKEIKKFSPKKLKHLISSGISFPADDHKVLNDVAVTNEHAFQKITKNLTSQNLSPQISPLKNLQTVKIPLETENMETVHAKNSAQNTSSVSSPFLLKFHDSSVLEDLLDQNAKFSKSSTQNELKSHTSSSTEHDKSSLLNISKNVHIAHSKQKEKKNGKTQSLASLVSSVLSSRPHESMRMNQIGNNTVTTNRINATNSPSSIDTTNQKNSFKNNSMNSILKANPTKTFVLPSSFQEQPCYNKQDGRYETPNDCSSFYICEGKSHQIKKCPKGLLFNRKDTVCDWPTNVECTKGLLDIKGNLVTSPFDDNEVYTKKFIH